MTLARNPTGILALLAISLLVASCGGYVNAPW